MNRRFTGMNLQSVGLWGGLVIATAILLFLNLDPENPIVTRTAAVAVLMAIWWITEAVPIPVTALLPVALFPLLGIMKGKAVAGTYFNDVIFLFVGGFIMAQAMQRWNLHRRVALWIVLLIGSSPRRILLSFMISTAFLSMWISNTATTMMMVPIALSVIMKLRETEAVGGKNRFSVALLLGIAYSASIGGMATLIGTPPNLAFARIFAINFPDAPEITFASWLGFGLPLSLIFLAIAWGVLTLIFMRHKSTFTELEMFKTEYRKLGKIRYEEKVVLTLSALLAVLWIFRQNIGIGNFTIPGWSSLLPVPGFIDDGTIAISVALLLFVIRAKSEKGRLMDWETAARLHWGIVILFGGGFALAAGFKESGLSAWFADRLIGLGEIGPLFQIAGTCTMITFLTELTSNTATTQIVLPLLGSLAVAVRTNPLLLMIPATISASCAFMLPVATPPNAIVFGSGELSMKDMVKAGIVLNLVGVVLITAFIYIIGFVVFNIDPGSFPSWA